jgi:hypothetical protein
MWMYENLITKQKGNEPEALSKLIFYTSRKGKIDREADAPKNNTAETILALIKHSQHVEN